MAMPSSRRVIGGAVRSGTLNRYHATKRQSTATE
jgi:hypothetical protein